MGATRDAPKAPHLEEVGHHIDVGPRGRHEHAEGEAGVDPLQVLLGGGRAAGEGVAVRPAVRPAQPPVSPPDSSPAFPRRYSHVGELEEAVQVDVSVEDVHGSGLGVGPPAASQRCKLQEGRWVRGTLEELSGSRGPARPARSQRQELRVARDLLRSVPAGCRNPPRPAGASVAGCCETGAVTGEAPTLRERCRQLESVFVPGYY